MFFLNEQSPLSIEQQLSFAYQIEAIRHENSELKSEINVLKTEINVLQDEVVRLKEQLELAKHRRFGKKSEVGEPLSNIDSSKLIHVNAHTRKKKTKGRLIDLSLLPRRKIYHDLPEAEKICVCCNKPLHRIGEDISEQVEVLPQRLYVEEHIRYKYAGCDCERVSMSPKEKPPIPKALAGSSLLTEVIINKYHYHLPLYRQSKILASYHAIIPDNTLGNWVMQVGTALMPIYQALWEIILGSHYLQVDETPIKILNPEKKGYLWCYYAPHVGKGVIIFELSLTRGGYVAEERLASYEGLIQTDGYVGYAKLRKRKKIEGLGCFTHARRKFDEVFKISKNKEGIAAEALKRLKPLYVLEANMREKNYNFKIKKHFRQKIARPLLWDFIRWLKQITPQVPPKSKLGEAIQYTLNQWPYLIKYLRHGMAEIDTNWIENKIRDIAVGKKNWLFMGNKDSGFVHALFYSLILSSIINNLNPRIYMHYLIMQIHNIRQGKVDVKQLLPHVIDHELLKTFAASQLQKAKDLLNQFN
jgi:transposase